MPNETKMKDLFKQFKTDNFKSFDRDQDTSKYAIFKQNVAKIVEHNKSGAS